MSDALDRRDFLKAAAAAGLGIGLGGYTALRPSLAFAQAAPARKLGPNDKVVLAVCGINSRGDALIDAFGQSGGSEIAYLCDVDSRTFKKSLETTAKYQQKIPKTEQDFRKVLEDPAVDAIVIATPDHWHAPMSIMALQAGKHVYCEKPLSHNPREGELLIEAVAKYGRVFQMGNQRRSAPLYMQAVKEIQGGLIGTPYLGKAWYANNRQSIGHGKSVPVPAELNYELWQGPAPRREYKDNIIHYHWHWFWNWGTGEACNNGTHEIDVCRWILGVDYPTKVSSAGGRFAHDDDWEFYDTQVVGMEFPGEKAIMWENRSCNNYHIEGKGRGVIIHGTEGTVVLKEEGYTVFDNKSNKPLKTVGGEDTGQQATNVKEPNADMTNKHALNFLAAVRGETGVTSPVEEGHKSVLLCLLANIAQKTGRTLQCDPQNGKILKDDEAMKLWAREYEPGWEPKIV